MKSVRSFRSLGVIVASAALVSALAFSAQSTGAIAQPNAQPTSSGVPAGIPPAANPTAAPSATPIGANSASPEPRRKRNQKPAADAQPSPTDTPTSPAFATLDGSWEVQVQTPDSTTYSYLDIKQSQQGISGMWRVDRGRSKYPFDGTYDGRLIRIVAKGATGDIVLSGYVDGASDMVGTVDYGKGDPVAFTAEHRAPNKGGGLLQRVTPGEGPAGPPAH